MFWYPLHYWVHVVWLLSSTLTSHKRSTERTSMNIYLLICILLLTHNIKFFFPQPANHLIEISINISRYEKTYLAYKLTRYSLMVVEKDESWFHWGGYIYSIIYRILLINIYCLQCLYGRHVIVIYRIYKTFASRQVESKFWWSFD